LICSCQGWLFRYSRTVSCAKLEWQSTADSAARISFSRMAVGATAQPTRTPAAKVLENVPR
jgi:hypothetical protein